MTIKNNLFLIVLAWTCTAKAQQNFVFTPEKPQPGDVIKITYTPAGDIANTRGKVEGIVYVSGSTGRTANDLVFTRAGKKYATTVPTDTSQNFIQLGFYVDTKFDNNYNEGYFIQLYRDDKVCKGSNASLASFYQNFGFQTQVARNPDKAIAAYEQEFKLYPDLKKKYSSSYFQLLSSQKKDGLQSLLEKDIEATLKAGLKSEDDYSRISSSYTLAKLPEQAKWVDSVKKERFPNGKWQISARYSKFSAEKDPDKKAALLEEMKKNAESDPNWKSNLPFFESSVLSAYIKSKNWDVVRKRANQMTHKEAVASSYNSAAWGLQEKNEDLAVADEFARSATQFTKAEWTKPSTDKPSYLSPKQWDKQREETYAMYADTYAMVLYKLNEPQKGFPFALEAAKTITKGEAPSLNNTYALLAEKVLSPRELKSELELFVKNGKGSETIKDILRKLYIQNQSSEAGFEEYMTALEKESYLKMLDELRKSMINEPAPVFTLRDLEGKTVNVSDLKGKIVVADFWATWCGPCLASFPGMKKLVEKYKENNDVKFVFIDTWERGDTKEKNAGDFIAANKYPFYVLMDNDNKAVEQYNVGGIPTKFVIDKAGAIRFKAMGFNGNDEKLISELTAMIEMASGEKIN